MTKSFLSRVAEDILKNSGTNLRDYVLVFPNIRSGSEMRRELALKISKPAWSPRIVSIDNWLTGLSGLSVADHLVELAYLYKAMIREIPTTGSFSDFIDLGETILSDFDDLDKYLVDTRKLFTVLTELKKIDHQFELSADPELLERIKLFWGGFQTGKSEHQEKWLEIWNRLYAVYEGFQNSMLEKDLGTSGMCYRRATEHLSKRLEGQEIQTKFLFIGFNILTKAEETLFRQLQLAGLAGFYWDYHPGYMTQDHEAGKFIRQNLDLFPSNADFSPFEPDNTEFLSALTDQKIRVLPSSSDTGQIQLMLSEIQRPQAKRRGIILADEGLFTDLLSAWPENIPVNFTSGYPLKDTQAAGYIINVLKIWLNFQTSGLQKVCRSSFVLDVLRHPWTRLITGRILDVEIQQIQRSYPDYVPSDVLLSWKVPLPFISDGEDSPGFILQLESVVSLLKSSSSAMPNLEEAALDIILSQVQVMTGIIKTLDFQIDRIAFNRLLSRFIHSARIPLETDRSANNQVMGILETRLIDFEEIFILSFNEGVWPSKSLPGSLIPYSLRKLFGLPTAENRDAMYSYYFYRLVQRAESLKIMYLTGHMDDSARSGEKSRYITQLLFDYPDHLDILPEPPVRIPGLVQPIVIPKSRPVMERLFRFLDGGEEGKALSASALNDYIDCPVKFAFTRIYDFNEPDEIAYASGPKGFGTLIHQVMNRLYKGYLGNPVGVDRRWLKNTIDDKTGLESLILEEYSNLMKNADRSDPVGKESLAVKVVLKFVRKILELDYSQIPLVVLGLEQTFRMAHPIAIEGNQRLIQLKGIIDRIDQVTEGVRIIDYKTGKIRLDFDSMDDLFQSGENKHQKEIFQVLLYSEFYCRQNESDSPLIPGLFRLGGFMAGSDDYRVRMGGSDFFYSEVREDFLARLNVLFQEVFDPNTPFKQTENVKLCSWCSFSGICRK